MATFKDVDAAKAYRTLSVYYAEREKFTMADTYQSCAENLDPPVLKCTHQTCDEYAMFRLSADETDDLPVRITYRCKSHIVSWVTMNTVFGTVKVDLL